MGPIVRFICQNVTHTSIIIQKCRISLATNIFNLESHQKNFHMKVLVKFYFVSLPFLGNTTWECTSITAHVCLKNISLWFSLTVTAYIERNKWYMNQFRDKVKNKKSIVNIIITIQLLTIIDIASSMALFVSIKWQNHLFLYIIESVGSSTCCLFKF